MDINVNINIEEKGFVIEEEEFGASATSLSGGSTKKGLRHQLVSFRQLFCDDLARLDIIK